MKLTPGTRVRHVGGHMATVMFYCGRHRGYRIAFDDNELGSMRADDATLTPVDPKLHEKWEALWPSFMDRSWAN